ncbi:threonine/serine dehydratase [Prosthecodimorpha staleyi]|uniref:Threonine/serine dehydratase n=1 Tax=Prosthecodimorpha staleyi TaxID=2840188 RepID=A0A947DA49_9HYPH|nr:threonine/serine dehydratase [Prosthecodimorpha staleyi]MBT9292706.1 threonine/serine dehydratase [Prosthecodimorpha staleyi]
MAEVLNAAAIETAYRRIAPHVRHTPVMTVEGAAFGVAEPIHLKLELLQHAGSFKPRGAFNNLLARTIPASGVTAASGGNHGAAVAYAAACLGVKARIFVPVISSPVKVARIRDYGADVVIEGERYADAQVLSEAYAAESGALMVHPFDSPFTVAGQGTVGLEWERDMPDLDTVLVAAGGGGLVAGIALWYGGRVKVVAVEPQGSRALHAALEAGAPVDVPVDSIAADSLGARRVGEIVHMIAREHVADAVLVGDNAIEETQRRLWRRLGIAAEPGGAAALSAIVSGAYRPASGERVGVLVCGANVDLAKLAVTAG